MEWFMIRYLDRTRPPVLCANLADARECLARRALVLVEKGGRWLAWKSQADADSGTVPCLAEVFHVVAP
jgi:hypothetical protein